MSSVQHDKCKKGMLNHASFLTSFIWEEILTLAASSLSSSFQASDNSAAKQKKVWGSSGHYNPVYSKLLNQKCMFHRYCYILK